LAEVTDVFKTDEDAPFLERAGIEKVSDPRFKNYSQRLARLRGIRKYIIVWMCLSEISPITR